MQTSHMPTGYWIKILVRKQDQVTSNMWYLSYAHSCAHQNLTWSYILMCGFHRSVTAVLKSPTLTSLLTEKPNLTGLASWKSEMEPRKHCFTRKSSSMEVFRFYPCVCRKLQWTDVLASQNPPTDHRATVSQWFEGRLRDFGLSQVEEPPDLNGGLLGERPGLLRQVGIHQLLRSSAATQGPGVLQGALLTKGLEPRGC